ncbi:MAG: CotH kinase family protein [Prolixibacteraceae bacterium]
MQRLIFVFLVFLLLLQGCYKEEVIYSPEELGIYDFKMEDSLFIKVLESRKIRYDIVPVPKMEFEGIEYKLDKMHVRGQTATNYQRKSFSVNLDKTMAFSDNPAIGYEKFKLISLVADYTYIENRLAHLLLNEFGLWPLKTFYTQVRINKQHQGLYLFIEDPEEYLFNNRNAEIVIRRYYRNGVSDFELNTNITNLSSDYYIDLYRQIYSLLKDYSGEELYNELSKRLNLTNYMRKIIIDFLLKNGDYTDEISLYASDKDGMKYFDILPWDYDDIFAEQPHEVGRDWSVGMVYGTRNYETYDDVLKEIGNKLIFSIEDDIDYTIAMDDFLYQKYLEELQFVCATLSNDRIGQIFEELRTEVEPFYEIPEVISQSKFDMNATSIKLFEKNIAEKQEFISNRVVWINDQISKQ